MDGNERLLITGGRVFRHGGNVHHPTVADVLIEGDRIAKIEPGLADAGGAPAESVIDARDRLVIPGLVDTHYHSHDVLLKGSFETLPLDMWMINALLPSYPKRSTEEVRARTLMGAAELIHSGVTTMQDMLTFFPFSEEHLDAVMQAYADIGIRVVFAMQVGDRTGLDAVPYWKEAVPEKFHSYLASFVAPFEDATPLKVVTEQYRRLRDYNERITWALAPSIPQLCSTKLLEGLGELSEAEGLQIFTHNCDGKSFTLADRTRYADHDGSSVKYLHDIGILGPRMGLVHSIWVRQDEIELMAETGTHVCLVPAGNLKTKSGVAPFRGYLDAGVSIGLGTDNSSNGDAQNMFHVMKFFTGLAAVCHPDPGPPSAEETLRISTSGGAEVLGLKDEVGDLQPGMKADVTILDLTNLNFVPLNSATRQLVFTESGQSVETVIVDGRVVMRDRKLVTIDEGELRDAVEVVMPGLINDRDTVSSRIAEIQPYLLEAWRKTQAHDLGMQRYVGDGSG